MVMSKKKIILDLPRIIPSNILTDKRGWFYEAYNRNTSELNIEFIQDNHSLSIQKGTLRGLHLQKPPFEQAKLIRVLKGKIFDVVVDLRPTSINFLKVSSFVLDSIKKDMLYIPEGFAHGFITLDDFTEVYYKVNQMYSAEHELTLNYNDPDIQIHWPEYIQLYLSEKDSKGLSLKQLLIELGINKL